MNQPYSPTSESSGGAIEQADDNQTIIREFIMKKNLSVPSPHGDLQRRATVQRCFHNLQAMTESGTNIANGFRNASAEWMAFAQDSIERNVDRMNGLMGCRKH
jgi:predicted ATP-grasp superfamily ATP-dependent carboligase